MTDALKTDSRSQDGRPSALGLASGSPASEIQNRIRAHKAYMRKAGIKRRSFMNGGLSGEEYSANKTLFALETELKIALK